jgi:prepilin-type processing-associated H-X9-DG protein
LPFIGEEELFDLIPGVALDPSTELGLDTNPISSFADLLSDPSMVIANNTQFPSVICPSNADYLDEPIGRLFYTMVQDVEEPSLMWIVTLNTNGSTDFGRTSYVPSLGGFHVQQVLPTRQIEISLEDAAGPMRNRLTSIHNDQLGDGASNTVCWSESLGYDLEDDIIFNGDLPGANFALHSPGLVTGIDWITGFGEDGPTRALFGEAGNSLPWLIGSNHLGANNVAFCDGSVRFLSNRTSRGVITALGCGNDGFVAQRTK